MNKRLYVGNLSYDTADEGLRELFEGAGTVVSAEIIRDNYSGRSKGFGFVEMETEAEAEAAINQFNGTNLDGRDLNVAEARPRRERRDRDRGYGGGGGYRDRW